MLPIYDGMRVFEKLKGNEKVENISVIILTVQNKWQKVL